MTRCLLAWWALSVVSLPALSLAQQDPLEEEAPQEFDVAVVTDGTSLPGAQLVVLLKEELAVLTAGEFVVRFKQDPAFSAGRDAGRVGPNVQAALDDPDVDLVLVLGVLTTRALVSHDQDKYARGAASIFDLRMRRMRPFVRSGGRSSPSTPTSRKTGKT